MEKFKFKVTKGYIVFIVSCYILLWAAILLNILRLCGAFGLTSYNIAGDILTMMFAFIFIGIITWVLVDRYYRITENALTLSIGFYIINIPLNSIELIQEDKESKIMALYYNSEKKGTPVIRVIPVNINAEENERFVKAIRAKNPKILYKLLDKNKKEEEL